MAGYKQGFGYEDFAADNLPAGVEPEMRRASLYSKREERSLGSDHKDAKKGGQNSFLHSVTKGSMAVGEYYDSVTSEYPKAAAFMEKAGIVVVPAVGFCAPVHGAQCLVLLWEFGVF